MKACILTIGNELLQGFTLDTNSAWIGQKILEYNINVEKKITLPDKHNTIIKELKKIIEEKYNYIFITGGLGPTHDDITKKAICELFSDKLYLNKEYLTKLKNKFLKKNIPFLKSHMSQAMLLKQSTPIENKYGSALGIYYKKNNMNIFIMPGVPFEMKHMMNNTIIPKYLKKICGKKIITINTSGIMESQLAEKLQPIMEKYINICDFAFLPSYKGVSFRLNFKKSYEKLDKIVNEFNDLIKPFSYSFDNETLEYKLGELLLKNKLTIATAESCTGGLIGKILTDVPGSSKYFLGSIIAYDNQLKKKLLGISNDIINKSGAASKQVAIQMAKNIRIKTNAKIGISTTGISGPSGGSKKKPIGLVYIGIDTEKKSIVKKFIFNFNRDLNRKITSNTALNMLRLMIEKEFKQ